MSNRARTCLCWLAVCVALLILAAAPAIGAPKAESTTPRPIIADPTPVNPLIISGLQRVKRADGIELLQIRVEGRARVSIILARMEGLPDGPERLALQLAVVRAKRETRLLFLASLGRQARHRGDLAAATEADRQIRLMMLPANPTASPTLIQPRDKARLKRDELEQGGRP